MEITDAYDRADYLHKNHPEKYRALQDLEIELDELWRAEARRRMEAYATANPDTRTDEEKQAARDRADKLRVDMNQLMRETYSR